MAEAATAPRVEITLSAARFATLAQMGRDMSSDHDAGKFAWTDREYAVYAISQLIFDAEDRA